MAALIAALLLGAVAAPPPDDDDDRVRAVPPVTAQAVAPPAPEDDDKPKTATPSQTHEPADEDEDEDEGRAQPSGTIVITTRRLDAARTRIDAALGSTVYSLTNETIENRPGGETGSISDILAQAPGVTLSGRTLNVRSSPANQVRINDVIVPEAISDPADHLSSRLAETTSLITGTLPAQFGFAPAGVISVTTKNGLYEHGGQAELFAGSDGMLEPAFEWAVSAAATSLFASGSFERDQSSVADAAGVGVLDRRNEIEGLGFSDHIIDNSDRLSMILGGSHEQHRFGETSIGRGTEERGDGYAVGTFQHSDQAFTVQASLFGGAASDEARFSKRTRERTSTVGTQIDASDELGVTHTLRFGILASRSSIHEIEPDDLRSTARRTAAAAYAQDAWKIAKSLTFNPGARLEWLRGLNSTARIEPRASLVWAPKSGLTAHVGYARYESAAPLGEQPDGADLPEERDNYFDGGIQQRLGPFTVGLDGYWRIARNYMGEHETIGSAVPTAFAFGRARVRGLEVSTTYSLGPVNAWANLSLTRATAESLTAGETLFPPETLAAASMQSVPLASERPVSVSGGLTWRLGKLNLSGDALASSGAVRTLKPEQPNGSRYSPYALFGLAAVYHARIADRPADLRLDLTNLTDARYFTRNASNLEGGWTRRGQRRAIAIGIEQGF